MREKELRIALVCYGGVSLAVYMHGVTKEIWHFARASHDFRSGEASGNPVQRAYRDLLEAMADRGETRLRVIPDILTGASAGGMNAVFLAEALLTGRSLDPLTRLWLDRADSDVLISPEARPGSRFTKRWAQPIIEYALRRPGNAVSRTVAPETREEVRSKLSRLIRSRWFAPPFSGMGMVRHDARQERIAAGPAELALAGQFLDLCNGQRGEGAGKAACGARREYQVGPRRH